MILLLFKFCFLLVINLFFFEYFDFFVCSKLIRKFLYFIYVLLVFLLIEFFIIYLLILFLYVNIDISNLK